MKRCTKCRRLFNRSGFYRNRKNTDGLQSECRRCHMLTCQARRRERGREVRQLLVSSKGGKCTHCGRAYPIVCYDLHHLDPKTKEFHFNGYPALGRALREAQKCILLCANCHRIEHERLRKANEKVYN